MAKTVPCKTCKHPVAKNAKRCPNCGVSEPGTPLKEVIGVLIVFLIFISLLIKAFITESPEQLAEEQAEKAQRTCKDDILAYAMAQDFVKKNLKSDFETKFPTMNNPDVSVNYLGECTSIVIGYVDVQNQSGASLKTKYVTKLRYNKEDKTYNLLEISIE